MRDLTDREIIQLLFGLPITGPDGIITAPGVLVVKAESATDNSDVILEAVDTSSPNACVHSVVDRMTRYFNGVAFTFSVPEEFINTELRFTVDSGVFLRTLSGVKEMHFGMVLLNAGTQIFPPPTKPFRPALWACGTAPIDLGGSILMGTPPLLWRSSCEKRSISSAMP